jgi:hypothetical protein
VRAEADQFLLSCVELGTFVKWLECLFAAIDVAAPIDDRDFPRDQSIPRIQRIRWFAGQPPTSTSITVPTADAGVSSSRRGSGATESSTTTVPDPDPNDPTTQPPTAADIDIDLDHDLDLGFDPDDDSDADPHHLRNNPINRLSVSSYPNEAIDPGTGKWAPEHEWSSIHDMHYARLCYSVLFYRSPRKSNFVISRGKQWFVDWATGRMFRVLPPAYGEVPEFFGPWQVIHTENRRI